MDPDQRLDHPVLSLSSRASSSLRAWWYRICHWPQQTKLGLIRRSIDGSRFTPQYGLKWSLGLSLLALVTLAWLYTDSTLTAAVKTQMASELLMHSQRLGKAAPNAIQGNADAFRQLSQSRSEIDQSLEVLAHGGYGKAIGCLLRMTPCWRVSPRYDQCGSDLRLPRRSCSRWKSP